MCGATRNVRFVPIADMMGRYPAFFWRTHSAQVDRSHLEAVGKLLHTIFGRAYRQSASILAYQPNRVRHLSQIDRLHHRRQYRPIHSRLVRSEKTVQKTALKSNRTGGDPWRLDPD